MALRPRHAYHEGDSGDGERAEIEVAHRLRPGAYRSERPALGERRTHEGQGLQQDDDHADAGHEPGYDRVRRVGDETTGSNDAQEYLYQTRHHDDRERLGQGVRVGGDDDRHRHRHRAGRTRYLGPRPAEDRCEQPHRDRPVHTGQRPEAGHHTEGQCHGQPHHRRCQAAEHVASESLEVVLQTELSGWWTVREPYRACDVWMRRPMRSAEPATTTRSGRWKGNGPDIHLGAYLRR